MGRMLIEGGPRAMAEAVSACGGSILRTAPTWAPAGELARVAREGRRSATITKSAWPLAIV